MNRTLTTKTTTTERVEFSEEEILSIFKGEMVRKYPQMTKAEGSFLTKQVRAGFGNMTREVNYVVFNLVSNDVKTKD